MPLIQSSGEPAFKSNLKAELAAGKPRDQALAIAYSVKRRAKRAAGGPAPMPWFARSEAKSMMHAGPVNSAVPGRTDKHNISVKAGSYVLPADHVSSLGQGNTQAGFAAVGHMFGPGGPYGVKPGNIKRGVGAPRPPRVGKFAEGGASEGDGEVPIIVAGGEFVLTPDEVAQVGGGDIDRGHEILDAWVKSNRKQHISTLKSLPGPAKK